MYEQANEIPSIPRETIRSAKAVFGPGNFYIQVGDRLDAILENIRLDQFADLVKISKTAAVVLSLVTFFEFVEGLTDDQATEAMRTRVDWKYALHLPVHSPVFHPNILCEFRYMLLTDPVGRAELQKLVDRLLALTPPLNYPTQNTEILPLLSGLCLLNRLNWISQAMQQALGALAGKYPDWLRQIMLPRWYGRFHSLAAGTYSSRNELSLEELGADIHYLLEEVRRSNFSEINELREIKTLRHIWEGQFEKVGANRLTHNKTSEWINCDSCRYYAG